jgi:quinol monooxygenase YgiN
MNVQSSQTPPRSVARYAKLTATEGRGDELAAELLQAAKRLENEPGCRLYLVNRSAADRDEIWVTELWADADAVARSLASDEARANVKRVMQLLVRAPELIELEPAGGLLRAPSS